MPNPVQQTTEERGKGKAAVQRAYANGEGGYRALAKQFGISMFVVRAYLGKNQSPSRKRNIARYTCAAKARFATEDDAIARQVKRVNEPHWKDSNPALLLLPYQCELCGGWHLGHRVPDLKKEPTNGE